VLDPLAVTRTLAFRIVLGAVRNTFHGHPSWPVPHPDFARSVAKRAAGTLLAHAAPGALAALARSHGAGPVAVDGTRKAAAAKPRRAGRWLELAARPILEQAHHELSRRVRHADPARRERLIAALRVLSAEAASEKAAGDPGTEDGTA